MERAEMGKASRRKQEARLARQRNPLRSLLRTYQRQSLLDLIGAALCSPTAVHQLAALNNARSCALSMPPNSDGRVATAEDLPVVIGAAHRADPSLMMYTDVVPIDPRPDVRFRRGGRLFRLHPEGMKRPMAVLEKAELASTVIDPTLVEQLGFGLGDYLDLALAYMDEAVDALAPSWTEGPPLNPHDPGKVVQIRDQLQRELGRGGVALAVITRDLSPEAAGQTTTPIQALLGRIVGV
jgi:hypothetical protein